MRVLMIPQISTGEVAAESDKFSHDCIIRALRAIEPTFVYWWFRRIDQRRMNGDDPGELRLFRERDQGFYTQLASADIASLQDLFSWQTGAYPIDAVFTSRSGVAPLLSLALSTVTCQYAVPVVLTEPRVYGPGEVGHNVVNATQLAIRAMGYAVCFGIYWSKWEKESALNAASQYVTPGVLKGWDERSFVVDALVDTRGADGMISKAGRTKRLLFAGRLNSNKRFEEVVKAYSRVLMAREGDVEAWVHSGTGAFNKLKPSGQHTWHRTSEKLAREDYWRLLGTSHVGAYLSGDEGANVTVQEMLACEIAMVLPDKPWVEKLFWPLKYPFLVKQPRDLPQMLDWLLDNWVSANARLAPFRELIEKERSLISFQGKFQRVFDAISDAKKPSAYRFFRKVTENIGRKQGRRKIPFSTLLQVTAQGRNEMPKVAVLKATYACYQAVRDLDDMTCGDPHIVMEDKNGEEEAPAPAE